MFGTTFRPLLILPFDPLSLSTVNPLTPQVSMQTANPPILASFLNGEHIKTAPFLPFGSICDYIL